MGIDGPRDEVLRFDPNSSNWTEIGKMSAAKFSHAIGMVSLEDYGDYCQTKKTSEGEMDTLKSVKSYNISKFLLDLIWTRQMARTSFDSSSHMNKIFFKSH